MTAPVDDQRLFSVEEANRMLPLIKRIVADIVSLSEALGHRHARMDALEDESMSAAIDLLDVDALDVDEWDRMQREIEEDENRLEEFVGELTQLGVEFRQAGIGEVDFQTRIDGRPAFLCWRLGEPEVAFWHREDAGFEERQVLQQIHQQVLLPGTTSTGGFPQPETSHH